MSPSKRIEPSARLLTTSVVALLAATSMAVAASPNANSQQPQPLPEVVQNAIEEPTIPLPAGATIRSAPMPADAMPLEEPPARESAMTRMGPGGPGTGLSQEQWNRRPVAQRGQNPQLEREWRATDNPNQEVVPGEMRSDREEIPAGFTKADADKAETMEAAVSAQRSGIGVLAAPGCQVYWPAPYEVCGAIRDKYNALGGPNSFLLFPKTNELVNPDGIGRRTEFMNGPIYWSPQGGAHPVVNHFLAAWARHGYENSYLGYPTTDEIINPDGIGRRQHFEGSTIYWHLNEAYSVGGAIADKWHELGAERADGLLGYPTSDELVLPDGQGRMNRFERGVIYWHPSTGAHPVTGYILDEWASLGYEQSTYGYPISEQYSQVNGGDAQDFQHGTIVATSDAPGDDYRSDVNFEKMIACLEWLPGTSGPLVEFFEPEGVYLTCESFRYIADGHMPDNITRQIWDDYLVCVGITLRASGEIPTTQPGSIGKTRWNSYGRTNSYVVYNPSNGNIVNTYTDGNEMEWAGCADRIGPWTIP